ncbi:MAG: S8 family peptidase [Bacteroidales bacterium]|nr:S8 family peptidase [Bacteroidales bacterium]
MKNLVAIALTLSAMITVFAQSPKCDASTLALMQRQLKAGATQYSMIAKLAPNCDLGELDKAGIKVRTRIGQMATLNVPVEAVSILDQSSSVLQYSISHPIGTPDCERTAYDTRTDAVHEGLGVIGDTSFNGEGVYIGITDWGFDYKHINFNNRAADNRRIDRAWDQFRLAGPAPEGYDYGTEIVGESALFSADCDTMNIYEHGTHGTHVAGIAAGRGVRDTSIHYRGQAPYARLLLSSFRLDEGSWLDAAAWMKGVAEREGRRLVVNSSWGMYTFSSLEGQSLLSQMIDTMSAQGVVFCTSAGNNGDADLHISKTFGSSEDTLRTYVTVFRSPVFRDYHEAGQAIIMWGEQGNDFKASIRYTLGDSTVWTSPFYSTDSVLIIDDTIDIGELRIPVSVIAEHDYPYGSSHRTHMQIDAGKTPDGTLELFITADTGTVHAWNVWNLKNHAGNTGFDFYSNQREGYSNGDHFYGVSEPGCAASCITVAAHGADTPGDSADIPGDIAYFSSYGPLINGIVKPDISAPGVDVISSLNRQRTDRSDEVKYWSSFGGDIYEWGKMSGTSMSSPAVTGIVALLLQANPNLTPAEVRECLTSTARNDLRTGPLHERDSVSILWGWGKADALLAVNAALRKLGINDLAARNIPLLLYPNPATNNITVLTGSDVPLTLSVYSIDGRLITQKTVRGETSLNVSQWPLGVYILRAGSRVSKFVKR